MPSHLMLNIIFFLDNTVLQWLLQYRSELGVFFFRLLTEFASPASGITFVFFLGLYFYHHHKWQLGLMNLIGLLTAEATTWGLKHLIARPRPLETFHAVVETSFSFPSGHATTAAFIFGLIGYLATTHTTSKTNKRWIIILTCLCILLIDVSRIYLGVHYLSDVLVGNIIGGSFLALTLFAERTYKKFKK